jgi:hypothetical protein
MSSASEPDVVCEVDVSIVLKQNNRVLLLCVHPLRRLETYRDLYDLSLADSEIPSVYSMSKCTLKETRDDLCPSRIISVRNLNSLKPSASIPHGYFGKMCVIFQVIPLENPAVSSSSSSSSSSHDAELTTTQPGTSIFDSMMRDSAATTARTYFPDSNSFDGVNSKHSCVLSCRQSLLKFVTEKHSGILK